MRRLGILQVSTADVAGGAERVAWQLFQAHRARGHRSLLVVGRRRTQDPDVHRIPNERVGSVWSRFWWRTHVWLQPVYGRFPGSRPLCRLTHRLAAPRGWLSDLRGLEDFDYPGTWRILELTAAPPDIVHCHNLHGRYFDLRALPWLSARVPVVLTLHDAWLLAGHCAHPLGCPRWRSGCGSCPDLDIYPAIRRDATALNWRRKRDIFARARVYVAAPCHWLMQRARQSLLAEAIVEARVIPYGVDRAVFRPAPQAHARAAVGLPGDADVLLFCANGARSNPFKDFPTIRQTVIRCGARPRTRRLVLVALGEAGPTERCGSAELRLVPPVRSLERLVAWYQAADLYLHAARADTFPNSVLEALACGVPVVATAVGGIPEQVRALAWSPGVGSADACGPDQATGILAGPADAETLSRAVDFLLDQSHLRRRLGANAVADVRQRFTLQRMVEQYEQWFEEIIAHHSAWSGAPCPTRPVGAAREAALGPLAEPVAGGPGSPRHSADGAPAGSPGRHASTAAPSGP